MFKQILIIIYHTYFSIFFTVVKVSGMSNNLRLMMMWMERLNIFNVT